MITMHPVDSHNIHSVGHDPETGRLFVRFLRKGEPGSLYAYSHHLGEPLDHHVEGIKNAESPTGYFNQIKNDPKTFPFERIE